MSAMPSAVERPIVTARSAVAEKTVVSDGIRWHVETAGSGPTILLLHGAGASSHSFRDLIPILAERFSVVVLDLPGHARSIAPSSFRPSLPNVAKALGHLLESMRVEPRVAVGHSAGAAVVARMTLEESIEPDLLVGLAAALTPFRGIERTLYPSTARLLSFATQALSLRVTERKTIEHLLRSTGSSLGDSGIDHYASLFAQSRHVSGVLAMMASWDLAPLARDLPKLRTPFLLLAGSEDRAVPIAHQRALCLDLWRSRLEVIAGVGHLLHEQAPATIGRSILCEADRILRESTLRYGAAAAP